MWQVICVVWTLIAPDKNASWLQLRTDLAKHVSVLDNVKVTHLLTLLSFCIKALRDCSLAGLHRMQGDALQVVQWFHPKKGTGL